MHVAEDIFENSTDNATDEVEALINNMGFDDEEDQTVIEESEAVEVLVSWRDGRRVGSDAKLSRGFARPGTTRPPIQRKDLDQQTKRVRCFNCNEVGHFSRNCKTPRKPKGIGKGPSSTQVVSCQQCEDMDEDVTVMAVRRDDTEVPAEGEWDYEQAIEDLLSGTGRDCESGVLQSKAKLVTGQGSSPECDSRDVDNEIDEIVAVWKTNGHDDGGQSDSENVDETPESKKSRQASTADHDEDKVVKDMMELIEHERSLRIQSEEDEEDPCDQFHLVHDAGSAVVDTGCPRGVVGDEAFSLHLPKLKEAGLRFRVIKDAKLPSFKYGNGQGHRALRAIEMEARLGQKIVILRLSVVPGKVPLLFSRAAMQRLVALLDLELGQIVFRTIGETLDLVENASGHFEIDLCGRPESRGGESKDFHEGRAATQRL